jgi:type IV pilus assembly protein PilW
MNLSRRTLPQRGFSMVELMIAITISLLLLAGVIQIFSASRQTYTLQDGMSRLQENARYALQRVSQDIARSGYMGCVDSGDVEPENLLSDQTGGYDYSAAIFGQENAGVDGTDILTLRYGSSGGIAITAPFNNGDINANEENPQLNAADPNYDLLNQYDILTVSDCEQITAFMITNDPTTSGGNIEHATGITATIGPNSGQSNATAKTGGTFVAGNDATAGVSVSTAFRTTSSTYLVDASSSGNGNSLYIDNNDPDNELIQGIEDFQVEFGVNNDNDLGADRYVDADDVGAANWNNVVSVRLTLQLNTVDPVQAGATIAKTFTTTVRLRNRGDVIYN